MIQGLRKEFGGMDPRRRAWSFSTFARFCRSIHPKIVAERMHGYWSRSSCLGRLTWSPWRRTTPLSWDAFASYRSLYNRRVTHSSSQALAQRLRQQGRIPFKSMDHHRNVETTRQMPWPFWSLVCTVLLYLQLGRARIANHTKPWRADFQVSL